MARLSIKEKNEVVKMVRSGEPVSSVAKHFEVTTSTVYNIVKAVGTSAPKAKKEVVELEIQEEESEEENLSDDEIDYKAWMEFWKEKYLEAHSILVQHQLV